MKIIIGAGKTTLDGWISTQESELDLLDRGDKDVFRGKALGIFSRTRMGAYDL